MTTEETLCIDEDSFDDTGPCGGTVRTRLSRSGHTASARCEAHAAVYEQRMDTLDNRLACDYPGWDNPHSPPPPWFDPGMAGEQW